MSVIRVRTNEVLLYCLSSVISVVQEEAVMLMAIYILCLYYAGLVNSVCFCAVYCCVADLQWLIASMPAIADFPLVPMHISEE